MDGSLDPYSILNVPRGASPEVVKAAYRAKAKLTHPDTNGHGSAEEFSRVQSAYDWFRKHESQPGSNGADETPPMDDEPSLTGPVGNPPDTEADVVQFIRNYMEREGLEVRFDGEFVRTAAMQMAYDASQIDRVLRQQHYDEHALVDGFVLHLRALEMKVPRNLIEAGVRQIRRKDQQERLFTVMRPLLMPLPEIDQGRADQEWERFVSVAFEMPTQLGVAVLKKFIHQVKCKRLGRPIARHLVPVFQSTVQGSGKSTAALRFLEPLKELRTEPALLKDFADRRSGDVYRYPVIFIDDMDQITPDQVPTLNSLVTGDGLVRRKMGSSRSVKIKQSATLIGTCNRVLSNVIPDEAGNRRFATMPFRNGEVMKGGDPAIWDTVNGTDFGLLWRSVDAFAPDPTADLLCELFQWQDKFRKRSPVEQWAATLDLTDAEIVSISDHRGTKARKLYDLFVAQTRSKLSETAFSLELSSLAKLGKGPFAEKKRHEAGSYYPHRTSGEGTS